MPQYKVKLQTVAHEHELTCVHAPADIEERELTSYDVARPGLQFAGFYDYFRPEQVQILGKSETAYLRTLSESERVGSIEKFFSCRPVAVVICNRVPPEIELVDAARRYDVPLYATSTETSAFMAQIINTLRTHLAPRMTVHGVLVQVHGEGVLIVGDSGIGKSEAALELVKRGHRLIADDAVEIRRLNRHRIEGCAPQNIRYMMELRGVGIIDVRRIYGVGAVLPHGVIDLVVSFVPWDDCTVYDRLGIEEDYETYLGVKLPKLTIPVAPARNLAIILEAAAMNNRQKRMGYNAAKHYIENYDRAISEGTDFMHEVDEIDLY